jgi:hypothetical protein
MHHRSLTSCSRAFGVVRRLDQKEVPLEERLACTLAADDKLENPAAAWPVLGDAIRSRSGPECPGGVAPVTAL